MIQKFRYPPARRDEVVDDYHGTAVPDPYRWLEEPDSAETEAWVAAQNELTRQFIDELPLRQQFAERLTSLWNYPKQTAPVKRHGRTFFQKNDGLQNQSVLVWQDGDAAPEPLLDPNTLSEDGTVALIGQSYSDDGRYLAYSLSQSGSDWQTLQILDIDNGEEIGDLIQWCKFTPAAWLPDNSGFYYARYPAPGEMPDALPSTHQRVYFHQLFTPQALDMLIYGRPDAPNLGFIPEVTDDGRYLILHVWDGTDNRNRIYYQDLAVGGEFVRLIDVMEAKYEFIANDGPLFYFLTDHDAPNGRVIALDITHPARDQWAEIIPETNDVIDICRLINQQFVVVRLHHASHRLFLYGKDGTPGSEIPLPTLGAILELNGRADDTEFYLQFQSFLYPPTVFRYDFDAGLLTAVHQPTLPFDPNQYETRQIFYPSQDGTQVPLFITHKKGLAMDGRNPTLLYGYGGFNISLPPAFAPTRLAWLERGGIYAQANLRGGTEYGEAWHQAGMLAHKQNVFDDFIAAAEWLIANGYTSPPKLAIEGRSNGGLLVAACMVQRPELFGAVHCGVPVIDMLRYHQFTAGRYWTSEYGNAENSEQFPFMFAYSPLHNIREGTTYPPLIITTADTDDRVVPMHAKKFAAALQAADPGTHPLLLRVEMKAGHGLGKPTAKLIEEAADVTSFLWVMLAE